MLASHYHSFPSDVALMLMGLGCTLTIVLSGNTMTGVPVEQVYAFAQVCVLSLEPCVLCLVSCVCICFGVRADQVLQL